MSLHRTITDKIIVILINICLLSLVLSANWLTDIDIRFVNYSLIKSSVAGLGSGILLLLTLGRLPYKPYVAVHVSWIKSSFLLLFLLGAISILWSVNKDFTISKWLLWWIGFGTFITAYYVRPSIYSLPCLAWGLFSCAGLIAFVGVLQYFDVALSFIQFASPASTFGNKNIATHVIILTTPIGLYLLGRQQSHVVQTWLITLTMAIIMAYIAYTQTRSSWVAIGMQCVVIVIFLYVCRYRLHQYIAWHRSKTIACWVSFCIFLLLINIGPSGWSWFLSNALERINSTSSVNVRFDIWAMTLTMINDNPVWGSGLGSWYQNEIQEGYASTRGMDYLRAHNDLLELATELGLMGVALLLSGSIALTIAVLAILKGNQLASVRTSLLAKASEPTNKAFFYFLLWVGLVGSFAQMQFSFPYQEAVPVFILGLYIGLIARYSENFVSAIITLSLPMKRWGYWLMRSLGLLIILLVCAIYIDGFRYHSAINRIVINQTIGQTPLPMPYIQSNQSQSTLRFLSAMYWGDFRAVKVIEEHALNYWPDSYLAMESLLNASLHLQEYKKAWEMIDRLRALGYQDYYLDDIAELKIYISTGEDEKFINTFVSLLNEDEAALGKHNIVYRNLLKMSFLEERLAHYRESLYNKTLQYYGSDCEAENNMAIHYWNIGSYSKAVEHLAIVKNSNDSSCLNPAWDGLLQQHQLAIQLDQAAVSS